MMPSSNVPAQVDRDALHRCGTAAILGRPNVGKSTLLNALVGQRLSVAGPKPQTTRHRILGIVTREQGQILMLDTPGLHRSVAGAMNRQLNRTARQTIAEADVVLHVIEAGRWHEEDEGVWQALTGVPAVKLLVMNKIDANKDKSALLPFIGEITAQREYAGVFLISAKNKDGIDLLERGIFEHLPQAPPAFPEDALTDRSQRFFAAELVREQLMLRLAQELPYTTTVEIEQFVEHDDGRVEVGAVIWVEREGQKGIVIGNGGAQLKVIGSAARRAMEKMFDCRVFLRLWVKVRENWSNDEAALRSFGYSD